MNYIGDKNIQQKICLICIIDRYKYSEKINNIIYPHIYKLLFTLFSKSDFNELFMFNKIPIKDIYNIFISYFLSIKNFENIEEVSFGDEFFMNKNQFLEYNDEYYQSIVSYLIDQYLINCKIINNNGNNILGNIKTKKLEIKEENLNNIYERFKIIYGFNKLFPNLENKKILELFYINDIKNNNIDNNNHVNYNYKIILIDFDNRPMKEDISIIFENIKSFILKNLQNQLNSIEMISFININFITEGDEKININSNFDFLPNIKELFINNNKNDNNIIPNNIYESKLFNKFEYVYLGYDEKDNLIFYRNGKNMIKSIDILDLLNIFNDKIRKINLKYENIDIIFNSDKSILKIINRNYNDDKNNINNIYNYSLSYLSDFIKNQNTINELIIEGFDFSFEEIQNKNIKKLSINYNENNIFVNYNVAMINHFILDIDLNLAQKFPQLEEINIGNIKNEKFLFNQLFKNNNFSNNLKNINIITYFNFKFWNIDKNKIKTNIKIKSNINLNNNQENSEEYELEEEENEDDEDNYNDDNDDNDLFVDEYQDILEDADPVVVNFVPKKKKKINKEPNKEENKEKIKKIILVKEKIIPYKKIDDNLFKKDIESYLLKENILYFDSNIIKTINNFYLIQKSLSLINNSIDIKKIKFNLLCRTDINKLNEYKNTKNLFVIFITEYSKIFCAYLKNWNPEEKGDDFFLDLNNNEICYHIKEDDKRKKSKNEISREKIIIRNDKAKEKNYDLKYYFFGEKQENSDIEELFEIYQIIF